MTDDTQPLIRQAADRIRAANHTLVLTGAGISAESGIPTFREAQTGLWAQYSPQDLATPEAFSQHPTRIWAWYQWRRALIARGGANAGHQAIADLGQMRSITIATQNVDGLHTAAGSPDVAELHGSIWRNHCPGCGHAHTLPVAEPTDDGPEYCPQCNAMARPDIVWFGESLPVAALQGAERALKQAQAVLVIGTSNQVYPAAALVDAAMAASHCPVIEVNPQATAASERMDIVIRESASQALPALVSALQA